MYSFDDMVKTRAKSEPISLPDGFNERNNHLLDKLIKNSSETKRHIEFHKMKYKVAIFLTAILLLGSITAAASELIGGDFFAKFFSEKSSNDNYNYIDTEQIKDMASNTLGTVINTDEIKIEVMDIIASGNTANVMVKVTAQKLDSVYYDNKVAPILSNYKFDNIEGSLFDCSDGVGSQYYYSNTDKSLAENQFLILYTFIGKKPFDKKEYDIKYNNLGYVNNNLIFVSVYDTGWQYYISLNAKSDYSKEISINQTININNYSFNFENIIITPLAFSIKFASDISDNSIDKYNAFKNNVFDVTINLKDGFKLDANNILYTCSQNHDKYVVYLKFDVPINVDNVKSLSLLGNEYIIR